MLDTLETTHRRDVDKAASPLDFVVKKWWKSDRLPPFDVIRSGVTSGEVEVQVNHGRWIVHCPDPDCAGAVLASDTDRRFVCPYCAFGVFAVVWPKDRADIEAVLGDRPVKDTRNWEPGDTVAALEAENAERLDHRGVS